MKRTRLTVLDRDGIININHGYVHAQENFEFIPGIFELCKGLQDRGEILVVATNQSGITRGYYTMEQFEGLSKWMLKVFDENNIKISRVFFCPHSPSAELASDHELIKCGCRKPEPGMLTRALQDFQVHPRNATMFGDNETDMVAAYRAQFGRRVLIGAEKSEFATEQYNSLDDYLRKNQ